MQSRTIEKARAAIGRTAAQGAHLSSEAYRNARSRSTRNLLERAGDILLLLAAFDLATPSCLGFFALLEKRLRCAYEEGEQC